MEKNELCYLSKRAHRPSLCVCYFGDVRNLPPLNLKIPPGPDNGLLQLVWKLAEFPNSGPEFPNSGPEFANSAPHWERHRLMRGSWIQCNTRRGYAIIAFHRCHHQCSIVAIIDVVISYAYLSLSFCGPEAT